jgi:hypothetical protein
VRQRIRTWLLASPDPMTEGPVTLATGLLDFLRIVLFVVLLSVLVTVLTGGADVLRALALGVFGYRITGAMDTALSWLFFGVAIPLAFVVAMLGMIAAFWFYRSWRWFVPHLVVAVLSVAGAWIYLGRSVMAPALMAHLHLVDWPADLELAAFEVCAIEVEEGASTARPIWGSSKPTSRVSTWASPSAPATSTGTACGSPVPGRSGSSNGPHAPGSCPFPIARASIFPACGSVRTVPSCT